MSGWFSDVILGAGRLPLFCFYVAFLLTFAFIRFSVRMIRAEVSWWPGNITPGGLHIHHVVFGTVTMVATGVASIAVPRNAVGWAAVFAAGFGIGTGLVLDEFALILHLDEVYWAEAGRLSVDAVLVAAALTGLMLLTGGSVLSDFAAFGETEGNPWVIGAVVLIITVDFLLAAVTLVKGKIWTGLIGLFFPVLLWFGALRVARPNSPWARRRYVDRPGRQAKAERRERRFRAPVERATRAFQDLVAGKPDAGAAEQDGARGPVSGR